MVVFKHCVLAAIDDHDSSGFSHSANDSRLTSQSLLSHGKTNKTLPLRYLVFILTQKQKMDLLQDLFVKLYG